MVNRIIIAKFMLNIKEKYLSLYPRVGIAYRMEQAVLMVIITHSQSTPYLY